MRPHHPSTAAGRLVTELAAATSTPRPPHRVQRAHVLGRERAPHTQRGVTGRAELQFQTLVPHRAARTDPRGRLPVGQLVAGPLRFQVQPVEHHARPVTGHHLQQHVVRHLLEPVEPGRHLRKELIRVYRAVLVHRASPRPAGPVGGSVHGLLSARWVSACAGIKYTLATPYHR